MKDESFSMKVFMYSIFAIIIIISLMALFGCSTLNPDMANHNFYWLNDSTLISN